MKDLKVGDLVYLPATIIEVDNNDAYQPYFVKFADGSKEWEREISILATPEISAKMVLKQADKLIGILCEFQRANGTLE